MTSCNNKLPFVGSWSIHSGGTAMSKIGLKTTGVGPKINQSAQTYACVNGVIVSEISFSACAEPKGGPKLWALPMSTKVLRDRYKIFFVYGCAFCRPVALPYAIHI